MHATIRLAGVLGTFSFVQTMRNCLHAKVTHMLSLFFQSFKTTGRPCSPCWKMKRKGRHGVTTASKKKLAASWAARSSAEVAEFKKKLAASWAARSPAEVAEFKRKLSEIQIKRLNQARWELREEQSKLTGKTYEKSNVVLLGVRQMFDGLKASHKNRLEDCI